MKEDEKEQFKPKKERNIRDQFDLKAEVIKVETKVAKAMTSDFVKCHVPEEKRAEIVDMVSNAYYSKKLQLQMAERAIKWEWNPETLTWTAKEDKEAQKAIEKHAEITFNTFMVKLEAYALLQRNDERNWLIKILNHIREDEEIEEEKGMGERLKELFKPNKEAK